MRNKIEFDIKEPSTNVCDCCNTSLHGKIVFRFDGSLFDPYHETERLCEDCAKILNEIDLLEAIYAAIRKK